MLVKQDKIFFSDIFYFLLNTKFKWLAGVPARHVMRVSMEIEP